MLTPEVLVIFPAKSRATLVLIPNICHVLALYHELSGPLDTPITKILYCLLPLMTLRLKDAQDEENLYLI